MGVRIPPRVLSKSKMNKSDKKELTEWQKVWYEQASRYAKEFMHNLRLYAIDQVNKGKTLGEFSLTVGDLEKFANDTTKQ